MIVPCHKVAVRIHLQSLQYPHSLQRHSYRVHCSRRRLTCLSSLLESNDKAHVRIQPALTSNLVPNYPWPKCVKRLPAVLFWAIYLFSMTFIGPYPTGGEHALVVQPSFAADNGGMSCVAEHCSDKLSKCLSDGNCSRGMGCFIKCAAQDSIGSTAKNLQGLCQARCMDLHESTVFNDFAHCAMAQNKCLEPLPADLR
jgi:hypothetical protein